MSNRVTGWETRVKTRGLLMCGVSGFVGLFVLMSFGALAVEKSLDENKAANGSLLDGRVAVNRVIHLMFSGEADWRCGQPDSLPNLSPVPQTAEPVLVESAQSEDATTRLRGLEGLARLNAGEHVDRFITALLDPDPKIRQFASITLEGLEPERVFDQVMQILCSHNPMQAAPGLILCPDARIDGALPFLRASLEKRMISVLESEAEPIVRRQAAAYGLGRMDSVAGIGVLAKYSFSPRMELALQSAYALVWIRDPIVIPRLLELTRHKETGLRWAALQRIGDWGGRAGLRALTDVAAGRTGADKALCDRALSLMSAVQDEQVIACLIEAMSSNPAVTRSAIAVLRRLTGEDVCTTVEEWVRWYRLRHSSGPAIPDTTGVDTVKPTPPNALRIIVPTPQEIEAMGE